MAKRTMAYYNAQLKKVEKKMALERKKKELAKKKDQLAKMR
jgi:hypothetical protein|tara:strand:- start:358 stop:480 length:123 start_codon:yes stop_codon:yes gene_type:complete